MHVTNESVPYPSFPEGSSVLIIGHNVNGLGDVAAALKYATELHEKTNLLKDRIVIATNTPPAAEIFNTKYHFTIIPYKDIPNVQNVALQIIASASSIADFGVHLCRPYPTLVCYEYGFDNHPIPLVDKNWISAHSLGIDQDKAGIMIDEELANWGFSEEALDPVKRLNKLQQASPALQKAIFSTTEDLDSLIPQRADSMRLYYAYAKNTTVYSAFIKAILDLNTKDAKDIVFVLPSSELSSPGQIIALEKLIRATQTVKTLVINKLSEEGAVPCFSKELNPTSSTEKTVTICAGSLSHQDIRLLLQASEPESISAGDHSFSENASANKCSIFVAPDFKSKFGKSVTDAFFDLHERCPRMRISIPEERTTVNTYASQFLNTYQLSRKDSHAMMRRFNESLHQNHSFFSRLPAFIQRSLDTDPDCAPLNLRKEPKAPKASMPLPRKNVFASYARSHHEKESPALEPGMFPPGKSAFVSSEQICYLQIDSLGKAKASGFEGVFFNTYSLGLGEWIIQRRE